MTGVAKALRAYTERLAGAGLLADAADVEDCESLMDEVLKEFRPRWVVNIENQSQQFQSHPIGGHPGPPPGDPISVLVEGNRSGRRRGW